MDANSTASSKQHQNKMPISRPWALLSLQRPSNSSQTEGEGLDIEITIATLSCRTRELDSVPETLPGHVDVGVLGDEERMARGAMSCLSRQTLVTSGPQRNSCPQLSGRQCACWDTYVGLCGIQL